MAIIASTQQGPPKFTGCISPANTSALLVTKANANSLGSFMSISYLDTGANFMIVASIPIDAKIRMTNNGILKTLATVQSDNGVADPTSGAGNQVFVNIEAYQCDVKRPNCECTTLDSFYVFKNDAPPPNGWVRTYTFSDGYSINLGVGIQMLVIGGAGLEFKIPVDGDWVCSCQSPGRTSDITTGCVKITSIVNIQQPTNTVMAVFPTTSWPKDKFASSEMKCALMLENGVYIFFIPDGGTYA